MRASLDTLASACVAAYGPRAKRMVLDERIVPESEKHMLITYEYDDECSMMPERFCFTVAEMLTGIFAARPEDYPDDGPIDPTAIFYSKWADRKKAAALDCLDGPVAFALDLELMRLHKRMNEESNEDCFRVRAYNTECAEEADLARAVYRRPRARGASKSKVVSVERREQGCISRAEFRLAGVRVPCLFDEGNERWGAGSGCRERDGS